MIFLFFSVRQKDMNNYSCNESPCSISNMTFPRKMCKYANYTEYASYTNYAKYDTITKAVYMMELKYIIRLVIIDRTL